MGTFIMPYSMCTQHIHKCGIASVIIKYGFVPFGTRYDNAIRTMYELAVRKSWPIQIIF